MSSPNFTWRLASEADDDMVDIALFGENEWGELEATRYIERIVRLFERLTRFPRSGRLTTSAEGGLRIVSLESHVIYYRVDESAEVIVILRVLHARMDARRHHLGMS